MTLRPVYNGGVAVRRASTACGSRTPTDGPLAQLGERCVRNAEVVGSNPMRSTSTFSFPSGLTLETLAEHAGMTLTAFCPACDRYATLRMQDRPTPPAVPGVRGPDREPAPQR